MNAPFKATSCKYCGSTAVEWKQTLAGNWLLLAEDGYRHHCLESYAAHRARDQRPAPKSKKKRHGAFLRVYGPVAARTHAVLTQTKEPEPGTPEAMAAELDADLRQPAYFHLTQGRK